MTDGAMTAPGDGAMTAVLCSSCGGAVAMEAGRSEPRCLFCGSSALQRHAMPEGIEPPEAHVPFAISSARAMSILREYVTKGLFRPGDLAKQTPTLKQVSMTAWAWSGMVETHWTALISAATRSGKRPISGAEVAELHDVLTPASSALSRAELSGVAPYSTEGAERIPEGGAGIPYEIGSLTRSVATGFARDEMKAAHEAQISHRVGANRFSGSALVYQLTGRPLLLPAWIGTYTYRGRVHRYVVNGQTGKLHGTRPISPWRVMAAIVLLGLAIALGVAIVNS